VCAPSSAASTCTFVAPTAIASPTSTPTPASLRASVARWPHSRV
jgi:hypothetical protein